jgi:hypothetical protein
MMIVVVVVVEVEALSEVLNYFPMLMMIDELQKIFHPVFECMNPEML